jgi:hypothetical protein
MLSTSNTISGIQAHPEMNGKIAIIILDANDSTHVGKYLAQESEETEGRCNDEQDGLVIFESIVDWVRD